MIKVIPLRNGTLMFPVHLTRRGSWYDRQADNVLRFPIKAKIVPFPVGKIGAEVKST
jgi:hypothetical protein